MSEAVSIRRAITCGLLMLVVVSPRLVGQTEEDLPVVVQDLLNQGNVHLQAGRLDRAIASYRSAVERAPHVAACHAALGSALVQSGDLNGALASFEAGLKEAPADRSLRFNAAVVARRLEQPELALDHVSRALADHPKDLQLHLLQASLLERLGRLDDASAALQTANGLSPGDPQILYRLGNAYYRAGRAQEAVDSYQLAIRKDKKLLPAHFNLGAVLFELGRLDEALAAYAVALAPIDDAFRKGEPVDPVNALAYRNLGAIHLQASDFLRAVTAYSKANQLAPDDAQVLYNLGFARYRLEQWDEARHAYETALALDPDLPLAYLHLGDIALRKGEAVEAVARLEAGVPQLGGDDQLEALRMLGKAYEETGRGGESEAAYRRVLDAVGEDPQILLALGRLAREDGRTGEARSLMERARTAAPQDVEVGLELAGVLGQTDDTTAQKALYGELLESGAESDRLWRVRLALALLELAEGRADAAASHLDRLAGGDALDAESTAVVAALRGVLRAQDGDIDGARKLLHQASGATSVAAGDALAVVDALAGRGADAVTVLGRSLAKADASTPVGAALRLDTGLLLWTLGRHEEARPLLEAAFVAAPDEPSLRAAMGDLALRKGELWQAVEHLGRAEELCKSGGGRAAPSADTGRVFQVQLAKAGSASALCDWVERAVGATRVAAAVDMLAAALARRSDPRAARSLVEAALTSPLGADLRAAALFVRGTLRLDAGDVAAAAQDLSGAVDGELPAALTAHAHNNLGVAYARLGRGEESRRQLESARAAAATAQPATLNLAILFDDQLDDGKRALGFYDAYLRGGGARSGEVREWADRLRELYP